jgi:hypothetical protein
LGGLFLERRACASTAGGVEVQLRVVLVVTFTLFTFAFVGISDVGGAEGEVGAMVYLYLSTMRRMSGERETLRAACGLVGVRRRAAKSPAPVISLVQ